MDRRSVGISVKPTEEVDTIAAIATPVGEGGIGIVRMSGPQALKIALRVFNRRSTGRGHGRDEDGKAGLGEGNGGQRPKTGGELSGSVEEKGRGPLGAVDAGEAGEGLKPRRIYLGWIVDPADGRVLDEVLLWFMAGPRSYTREDVVEISCHGGATPLRAVLRLLLREGARLAEPGEFTRRAFINGRIDLAQAEAVLDTIRAKTDAALEVAVKQLRGSISGEIERMTGELVGILARIEAQIDFPDEELGEDVDVVWRDTEIIIKGVLDKVEELLDTAEAGIVLRKGVRVVITGKPNVGKSSLLNALVGFERAIVTAIPGTTRDAIEETVFIGGLEMVLTDTAGLRQSADEVEAIGIEHTLRAVSQGDLVLVVLDDTTGLQEEDRVALDLTKGVDRIVVVNKEDVGAGRIRDVAVREIAGDAPIVRVSAREGINIGLLRHTIAEMAMAKLERGIGRTLPEVTVTRERHAEALRSARKSLGEALSAIEEKVPLDMVAIDIRRALGSLGEITGKTVDDAVLDRIFGEFCLGK
ncbi:MAG TPA: tRNA uridine-5-carboxymethylaminomethyl(34) synthesis GTPase MnmE [Clostridia bacterium]|nr:tRNA uridine-5-carboxymethylaminomethyl(34) synthesis GTPase MnmE [Clostridia bacterium]